MTAENESKCNYGVMDLFNALIVADSWLEVDTSSASLLLELPNLMHKLKRIGAHLNLN